MTRRLAQAWWQVEQAGLVRIGLTDETLDYFQRVNFIDGPLVGAQVSATWPCIQVEAESTNTDLTLPLGGQIVARNDQVLNHLQPALTTKTWLFKIKPQ